MSDALQVQARGVVLDAEIDGDGPPLLLLHGLTATRRYVLHGSRSLVRDGYRLIAYDARGHGSSPPDPGGDYTYGALAEDALAVLDAVGAARAVLVGQSMGAATAVTVALRAPDRVAGLVAVTPAHLGAPSQDLARWDALADGLETRGVDGFMAALGEPGTASRYSATVLTMIRQRLARHEHMGALAQALRTTPRSAAFAGLGALSGIACPTLVVGSRDEADPDHPLAVAEAWATQIPGAELLVEEEGESPLAWRGGSLSAAIARFLTGTPGWDAPRRG